MKKMLLLTILALPLAGCQTRLSTVLKEMGKDNATVHVRVTSIYGVVEFTRTNPGTNTSSHTIAPDGSISVAPRQ
jgi:hypothetical protein